MSCGSLRRTPFGQMVDSALKGPAHYTAAGAGPFALLAMTRKM